MKTLTERIAEAFARNDMQALRGPLLEIAAVVDHATAEAAAQEVPKAPPATAAEVQQ